MGVEQKGKIAYEATKQEILQHSVWHWLALRLIMPAVRHNFYILRGTVFMRGRAGRVPSPSMRPHLKQLIISEKKIKGFIVLNRTTKSFSRSSLFQHYFCWWQMVRHWQNRPPICLFILCDGPQSSRSSESWRGTVKKKILSNKRRNVFETTKTLRPIPASWVVLNRNPAKACQQ